jgi:hypothetical protein
MLAGGYHEGLFFFLCWECQLSQVLEVQVTMYLVWNVMRMVEELGVILMDCNPKHLPMGAQEFRVQG